mmetsp:Transcript_44835/g.113571  ORF Transcript_44835/g.113571 Transcript_44835/m.113571 type:complete len:205 (+) Transcript_44835:406-1020(+)
MPWQSASLYPEPQAAVQTVQPKLNGMPGQCAKTTLKNSSAGTAQSRCRRPGPGTMSAFSITAWPFLANLGACAASRGAQACKAASSLKSSLRWRRPSEMKASKKLPKDKSLTRLGGCAMMGVKAALPPPPPPLAPATEPIKISASMAVTALSSKASFNSARLLPRPPQRHRSQVCYPSQARGQAQGTACTARAKSRGQQGTRYA